MRKRLSENVGFFLFVLCWIAYFSSYIGRLNYSSVMSSIIEEGILGFSQAGSISMVYFFSYGIGQFFNGILGDRVKPQNMIFLGLFFSGLANFMMGTIQVFPVMMIMWGINGYTQAMIWPPIIRIFAEKYSDVEKKKCSVDIVSSMAVGTLASYLLSAYAMKFFSWEAAFFLAAGILIFVAFFWMMGYKYVDARMEKKRNLVILQQKDCKENDKNKGCFGKILLSSGLIGILLPVMIHGVLKDGMTQWVPTFIYERFEVTASFSVVVTMVLPLINLAGAYIARFVDRKHPQKEILSSVIFFVISSGALILLLFIGKWNVFITVGLFAIVTVSMMAVNTLYVNLIPLHFEKEGKVATISGFLNSVAYLGSALSTFSIGVLVEYFGWDVTICVWIGVTVIALCCVVWKKDKEFK